MGLLDQVSSFLGTDKSGDAIAAQQASAAEAAKIQKEMYEQSRTDLAPWREAGGRAVTGMEDKDYMRDFTMSDFNADPGYQFRMDEGTKALERSAAAKGGLMGGATLKGLTRFSQDTASNEYQNAYNRFNQDRDRRFGRLSDLSHQGQAAAGQTANNSMAYGQNMANTYTGMGNAIASAKIAQGNSNANLINQGTTAALTFSDERLKEEIEPISKDELAELKANLKAYRFKYKNQEHGKGEHIGVMAQDLEKSKLGRTLVSENSEGFKQLNINKVMMLFLATMAEA